MTKRNQWIMFTYFLCTSACAGKELIVKPDTLSESRVEISYVLGHTQYSYVAIGDPNKAEVSSYRDERLLEKQTIPLVRYQEFIKKVENIFETATKEEVDENCRTPYRVFVVVKKKEHTATGCRSADSEGLLGQVLKEGEFLFYSTKSPEHSTESGKDETKVK